MEALGCRGAKKKKKRIYAKKTKKKQSSRSPDKDHGA